LIGTACFSKPDQKVFFRKKKIGRKKEIEMIQGYTLRLDRGPDLPALLYHGNVYGDGKSVDSRTDDELSGRCYVNRRFNTALDEYGRYAFTIIWTRNYDSDLEAILDEKARIARDDTTHPDKGLNIEEWDKKRHKKALADHTPGASEADLLAVAWEDFRRNHEDVFQPFDTPENVARITDIAKKEPCSIATAFHLARESELFK
jgi:hypothetical protein